MPCAPKQAHRDRRPQDDGEVAPEGLNSCTAEVYHMTYLASLRT